MSKKVWAVMAATLLALGVWACGGDEDDGGGDGDPITIGGAIAQTGFFEVADGPASQMLKFGVEDINSEGGIDGRDLTTVFADTKSDPNQAARAALEVMDQGADAVTTSLDYDFGRPAAQVATDDGLLVVGGAGSARYGAQGIGPLAFNVAYWAGTEGAIMAEFGYEEKDFRNAYLLLDDTIDYTRSTCSNFETRWEELGGKVIGSDSFQNDDASFNSVVSRLRSSGADADALVVCSYNPGLASLIRQIRAANIDTPIMGFDSFDGAYWLEAIPDLSDVYYVAYGSLFGDDPDEKVNELFDRYREVVGEEPSQSTSLIGYAVAQVMAEGFRRAGGTEGEAVAEELESLEGFETVLGELSYSPDLHITLKRPMRVMQIQNGKQSFVELWEPEKLPPLEF